MFDEKVWNFALERFDIEKLCGRINDSAALPWDHIDAGVSREFLQKERERAKKRVTTIPCGRFERERDRVPAFICHSCGIGCAAADLPVRPRRPALVENRLAESGPDKKRPRPNAFPRDEKEKAIKLATPPTYVYDNKVINDIRKLINYFFSVMNDSYKYEDIKNFIKINKLTISEFDFKNLKKIFNKDKNFSVNLLC